jgi:two-component system, chemotaxis family, sensor histidine kinase and response regulator WspE
VSKSKPDDMGNVPMAELFRVEAETQAAILTSGLLELERSPAATPGQLETLMRAAHSLKGAARIVNLQTAVRVAHALEDCFALAQQGQLALHQMEIDLLFRGIDLLAQISKHTEASIARWNTDHATELREFLDALAGLRPSRQAPEPADSQPPTLADSASPNGPPQAQSAPDSSLPAATVPAEPEAYPQVSAPHRPETPERVVRLTAESLNRLLGLAGESLVESRWLRPFADSLQRLKRHQTELSVKLDDLHNRLSEEHISERAEHEFNEVGRKVAECQQFLSDRMQELDLFDRRSAHHSQRMYLEVLRTRMRPFSDGVRRFPRMVRDLAHALGKEVRLEIIGENTQVDRDILERLESPLAHLLRNAVDHGCETPEQRQRAGKSPEGTIRIEARHSAGMLVVAVTDDGAGVQLERVREAILTRRLATPAVAENLTESELLEFLFLPGFTLKENVTEISGRGVGLDVVQNMVRSVRGNLRVSTQAGRGLRVHLQLPLTLSVLRALLVEVAGEPYAIPSTQIAHALKLQRESIDVLENHHHFRFGGQQVGLLTAHQVFDCGKPQPPGNDLPVVVLGDRNARYGLVVDRFLGERELVVQPLDARLGKVKDIGAAALMEDGSPVLIVDVDDMVRTIEKLISEGPLTKVQRNGLLELTRRKQKRILTVDDSLTVRELVRKLLATHGYLADVAVDGMDAWNAVRTGHYDLVIADVDMPRLDGIELATLIKKDPLLKSLPVMIVSYKDREEDRLRGLEAGADYYLTKGSFHDETLLQAVVDLIGDPEA